MRNLTMNFVTQDYDGDSYQLVCTNKSSVPWTIYVYQKMPRQPSDIFSLAWFASPYKIVHNGHITFKWSIDYSFVWGQTGVVAPGVTYDAGGEIPCSIQSDNQTRFSLDQGAPQLAPAFPGGQPGSLTINMANNVPNNVFATGIGMSGQGTFVQQALANAPQVYTPTPRYYVAAGNQVQMGQVLAQMVVQTKEVVFEQNVFKMYATLSDQQKWIISEDPQY